MTLDSFNTFTITVMPQSFLFIYTCGAMYSFILIFLACVIFIHGWNKQFLDHIFIKIIFPYSGILYFVMNYRIKGTIKLSVSVLYTSYRLYDNFNVN